MSETATMMATRGSVVPPENHFRLPRRASPVPTPNLAKNLSKADDAVPAVIRQAPACRALMRGNNRQDADPSHSFGTGMWGVSMLAQALLVHGQSRPISASVTRNYFFVTGGEAHTHARHPYHGVSFTLARCIRTKV